MFCCSCGTDISRLVAAGASFCTCCGQRVAPATPKPVTLEETLRDADLAFQSRKFELAAPKYAESFTLCCSALHGAHTGAGYATAAGWLAAVLTGGFGLEDLIIVPGVAAVVNSITGTDVDAIAEIAVYSTIQELSSIAGSDVLLTTVDQSYLLQRWAFICSLDEESPIPVDSRPLKTYIASRVDKVPVELCDLLAYFAEYYKWQEILAACPSRASAASRTTSGLRQDYDCLGVAPTASMDEVRTAYRRKVAEWHPDKYTKAPREIQDFATARMTELNIAYENICRTRRGKAAGHGAT